MSGADFTQGVPFASLRDGEMVAGHVGEDEVVLARVGDELFAVGAHCTHYHGALADGVIVGDTVRCPLHHACFSLRTGNVLRAPALDSIACWRVERDGDTVFVRDKLPDAARPKAPASAPASVGIIGGGGAGLAAAEMLRREGYDGAITMISADRDGPVDRPNLSKDYLAGEAQEDWIPLRGEDFYRDNKVELILETRVTSIDAASRRVRTSDGRERDFGALLMATGAEPVRLSVPGADGHRVHYLRSLADSKSIIDAASRAHRAVVIGASFIGLEVAASLRTRGLSVHIVAPDRLPLQRVMAEELGTFIKTLHESHGVTFHLGETVERMDERSVTLSDGDVLDADLIVAGIGVRPLSALAESAGLAVDRGILVNEYLEASAPGIYAAGDVARWMDRRSGERRHVEHWVVAERQGQVAARNILGRREPFDSAPFFWSQHYDVTIRYVGYAPAWDRVEVSGTLAADRDASITFKQNTRTVAVATISRDRESLLAEISLEQDKARAAR